MLHGITELQDGEIEESKGLTTTEMDRLLKNEPDFAKRIVTPLKSNRTKRKSDVTYFRHLHHHQLLSVNLPKNSF
jgi:hypothetical protein